MAQERLQRGRPAARLMMGCRAADAPLRPGAALHIVACAMLG